MSTKPRVAHVISELEVGGTERSLLKLLPYLEEFFDNQVVCELGHGSVGAELTARGISVHYMGLPSRFSPVAPTKLRAQLSRLKPAAVIGNLIHADIMGRLAARSRYPFISNQRSSFNGRGYLRYVDYATQSLVQQYVVQTEPAKRRLQQHGFVPDHKITVIPNMVETLPASAPRATVRQELGIGEDELAIMCVSNLRPGKGHSCLIRALYKLQTINYKLLLVGDGPLRSELTEQIGKIGLSNRVTFLGLRNDIGSLLAASDIFVLPSEAEGMSNALLEAMAAGLPCIAADISINHAVITPGTTGLLFSPGTVEALAGVLKDLLRNADLRYLLGRAAREYTADHHHPDRIAKAWREVLLKAIA